MIQIHPQFLLNGQSFTDFRLLTAYLEKDFPADALFLKELSDGHDYISVLTSGSTGTPKKIALSKKAMLQSAASTGNYFNLVPATKALHALSSEFIAGKMMWVRALHLGWHHTLVPVSSHPLHETSENFDFTALVPLQAQNCLNELHRVKKIIIGGAPLSLQWEQKLSDIDTEIYLTYGMTESITHIAVRKIGTQTAFHTLPMVQISTDQRGCLVLHIDYLHPKEIVTNDLVHILTDNSFEWLGRIDHVINSGGVKLIPESIEKKLQPFISAPFFIAGLTDEKLGQKVSIFIESTTEVPFLSQIFNKAGLQKYEIPKEIIYVDSFARTESEKIDRRNTILRINQ